MTDFIDREFTIVKGNKAAGFVRNYEKSHAPTLYQLHDKPSENKLRIYRDVYNRIPNRCLHTVRVWGNRHKFGIGWVDYFRLHVVVKSGKYIVEQ